MAVSASGVLTTTGLSGNAYTVTGISGMWNGYTIMGLLPTDSYGSNDNLLFPGGPYVDNNGITFQVNAPGDDGNGAVNLFYNSSGYTEDSDDVGYSQFLNIAFPTTVFNFSYYFPGEGSTPMDVSATGRLTTTQTGPGTYLVTDISGTWNGLSILGLAPVDTYGSNDNLLSLFPASPYLSDNGITFTVPAPGDDGNGNVNVFYNAERGSYTEFSDNVAYGNFVLAAPAPEPDSRLLLGAGLLAVCLNKVIRLRIGKRARA
jgi:hypothetical protein